MSSYKAPSWLKRVLLENSTLNYRMEYKGYFSNHIAHGIIAIARLGGDEERARLHADWYIKRRGLEPPVEHDQVRTTYTGPMPVPEKRTYKELIAHYEAMIKAEGVSTVVQREFAWMQKGSGSALFHGLIQTGYGASVSEERIILEGLAYLHWSYEPMRYEDSPTNHIQHFGEGKTPIVDVLAKLSERKDLIEKVHHYMEDDAQRGPLQSRLLGCLRHHTDEFIQYCHDIQLPSFFNNKTYTVESIEKLVKWFIIQILYVFCKSQVVNNFVLLHGVTGCWSLRHIVPMMKKEDALVAVRNYVAMALMAYVLERCSPLTRDIPQLQAPLDDDSWKKLIDETLAADYDEHVYKLVQVCYDMWRYEGWSGPEYDPIYLCAARTVLDNDFSVHIKSSPETFSKD